MRCFHNNDDAGDFDVIDQDEFIEAIAVAISTYAAKAGHVSPDLSDMQQAHREDVMQLIDDIRMDMAGSWDRGEAAGLIERRWLAASASK